MKRPRAASSEGFATARSWRIGVDVGGTFTDMVVADDQGGVRVHKVPSVPHDPTVGVLAAVALAAGAKQLDTRRFLECTTLFAHGSTIATNTVLEAKGAKVGLLTTEGFRDFLELRRGQRENPWDHRTPYAPVLVPRYLRLPVRGRIDAAGKEVAAFEAADVERASTVFREEGVESIAICLLNSFLNPDHERAAASELRRVLGDIPISISSDIAPIMGEYERGSTTVLNAYVAPRTVAYLQALNARLLEQGLGVPILLVQNNGGAVSVGEVANRPVSLLLSGPAAGVGSLSYYAEAIGSDDLVSMEIGGTSCDVILMHRGKVAFSDHMDIGGYTCVSPSAEVHTIGAGGGTMARVDDARLLHVGPQGAGARPGPACYGLGGQAPTITDAQVVLGRLRPGTYAGGTVAIDSALAREAVTHGIARPLDLSVEEAAAGMIRLMEQKLLLAVQRLSTERGYNARHFTLVAAGGAGPLHGAAVGRALGCRRVHIPRLAGAFCALGMLHSSVQHDYMRVHFADLDDPDHAPLDAVFADLERQARVRLEREGFVDADIQIARTLDLRYVGQQWDITVALEGDVEGQRIRRDFDAEHDRLFGHTQPGGQIEIMKARVTGVGRLPSLSHPAPEPACDQAQPFELRPVWIDPKIGWHETPIYRGAALAPGHVISGPAIIDEQTTTVLVGHNDTLEVGKTGNFDITFGADNSP